ncbi:MAG: acylphosphatase [Dehalococcoidia bacterium]|nr:acylphosphatase [Dehalococcoidia bacterium]
MAKFDLYVPQQQRVLIYGKVQGVGFRLWIRNVANTLSLVGSCRQLPDGSCEAIVQGERNLVKQFIVACKRGPSEATVERVEVSVMPVDTALGRFDVER